jgi:hypothetical protein
MTLQLLMGSVRSPHQFLPNKATTPQCLTSHVPYLIHRYLPPTVKRIIARGGDCWIGEVDDTTVLKYPQTQEKTQWGLQIEAKMFEILGSHPRPFNWHVRALSQISFASCNVYINT